MNTFFKITALFLLSFAMPWTVAAQDTYESTMGSALEAFAKASEPGDFITAAKRFEQIGKTATDQWTPLYYAAYCQLIAGVRQETADEKDYFFDQAFALIETADSRQAENSEIYALKGYIQYLQMSVDPQSRLHLIADAEMALDKAAQLEPGNPRPAFIKAQNTFYTPEPFGGGANAAKPLLEKALEKFEAFKPDGQFAPNWGKERCEQLLRQASEGQ